LVNRRGSTAVGLAGIFLFVRIHRLDRLLVEKSTRSLRQNISQIFISLRGSDIIVKQIQITATTKELPAAIQSLRSEPPIFK
jgi:hypothetical protein